MATMAACEGPEPVCPSEVSDRTTECAAVCAQLLSCASALGSERVPKSVAECRDECASDPPTPDWSRCVRQAPACPAVAMCLSMP